MTCESCLHYEACKHYNNIWFMHNGDKLEPHPEAEAVCKCYTDKSRFVELPCKVWDRVWIIDKTLDKVNGGFKKVICEGEIIKVSYNGFTTPMEWLDYRWDSPLVGQTTRHDRIDLCIGKTVFPTREAAEVALKGATNDL